MPGRITREQTKGQPVQGIQIVYYTKSDLNSLFNMWQRYIVIIKYAKTLL